MKSGAGFDGLINSEVISENFDSIDSCDIYLFKLPKCTAQD